MSDGMAQACVLSKAVLKLELPETILHSHSHLDVTEQQVYPIRIFLSVSCRYVMQYYTERSTIQL